MCVRGPTRVCVGGPTGFQEAVQILRHLLKSSCDLGMCKTERRTYALQLVCDSQEPICIKQTGPNSTAGLH